MKLKQKFSEADLERIKQAVHNAEDKISGEIVPVIVDASGDYEEVRFKSSLIFGLVGFGAMIFLDRYVIDASQTLYYDPVFIFFVVLLFSIAGFFAPSLSTAVKRMFLSRAVMDETTRQRAETCFLENEVFITRHRTGIMIFVSFFEHEVIVMADKGISKLVEQKEWDSMVKDIITHIRGGHLVEGLEAGVKRCGEILLEKGFHKSADDINELGDDLRIN